MRLVLTQVAAAELAERMTCGSVSEDANGAKMKARPLKFSATGVADRYKCAVTLEPERAALTQTCSSSRTSREREVGSVHRT